MRHKLFRVISWTVVVALLYGGRLYCPAPSHNRYNFITSGCLRPVSFQDRDKSAQLVLARKELEGLGGNDAGKAMRLALFDEIAGRCSGNHDITGPQAVRIAEELVRLIINRSIANSLFTDTFWSQPVAEEGNENFLLVHLRDAQRIANELFKGDDVLSMGCLGHDISFAFGDLGRDLAGLMKMRIAGAFNTPEAQDVFRKYRYFEHSRQSAVIMRSYLIASGVSPELAQHIYDIILYHDAGPDGLTLSSGEVVLPKIEDLQSEIGFGILKIWLCDGISMFGQTFGACLREKDPKVLADQLTNGIPNKLRRIKFCATYVPNCVEYTYQVVDKIWPASQYPKVNAIFKQAFVEVFGSLPEPSRQTEQETLSAI